MQFLDLPPSCIAVLTDLSDLLQTCHNTELQILRAITVGLGISEDYLVKYHNGHDNQLRLLHYPRSVLSFPLQDGL